MKRLAYTLMAGAWAFAAVSCSAVRECRAPELNLPETIVAGVVDSTTVADIGWWEFYGDAALCDIIRRTLDNNKDMLAAAGRVERTRQVYRIDKANRLPDISGRGYGNRGTNEYYGGGVGK